MTTTRTPLMVGNWKMNMDHLQSAHLVQQISFGLADAKFDYDSVEVGVLPPFTNLRTVQTLVEGDDLKIRYGSQDISAHDSGAYTGEISAAMLTKLGVTYACIGHSERRQYHGETDESVNAKTKATLAAEITPIVCVGESQEQREAGSYLDVVRTQVRGALADLDADQISELVVAYEPVWAIGTGLTATPEDAQEVCAAIRELLGELATNDVAASVRVLYGGSMKPDNVVGLMECSDIDGGLIGGASLKAEDFVSICRFHDHATATA